MRRSLALVFIALLLIPAAVFGQNSPNPLAPSARIQNAAVATGNGDIFPTGRLSTVTFQLLGTLTSLTVTFEGSNDPLSALTGAWFSLTCYNLASTTATSTATAVGLFRCNANGIQAVRARVSTYGSGNVTVQVSGTSGVGAVIDQPTTSASQLFTDVSEFYSALVYCQDDVAVSDNGMIPTRVAAKDWALARTAAGAETINITCELPAPYRTSTDKGYKLTGFSVVHQITVAALTSNTFNDLSRITYVNATANAIADYGGSITVTLPTATQATPYVTAATVGTPAFMNVASAKIGIDFTAVLANTGVYRLYGILANWTIQN